MSATPVDRFEADQLAGSIDESLGSILSVPELLEACTSDQPLPGATRRLLVELGWPAVVLAEDEGGLGLDATGHASLAAVAGRRLLPAAFRGEAFLLAPLLAALARRGDSRAAEELAELLAGERRGGGALRDPGAEHVLVALAPEATLAALATDDGAVIVDLAADGVRVEPIRALDAGQGVARLTHAAGASSRIVEGEDVARAIRSWRLASLSEAFGAAQAPLALAAEYARTREQFGRPIVEFQAVAHLISRAAVGLEAASAGIGRLAGAALGDAAYDALERALVHAVPAAARTACEIAIQVHGGMGFTWELGIHLNYRRVLAIQYELGGHSATAAAAGAAYLAGRSAGR